MKKYTIILFKGVFIILKFIEAIQVKYWNWQYGREVKDIDDTWEFIWGIKSYCDLSPSECNISTMNDIDIMFNKKEKRYSISIETMLFFDNGLTGEKHYINELFEFFTCYMISTGHSITQNVRLYDAFTIGNSINSKYETIEELYTNFKFLVAGFTK